MSEANVSQLSSLVDESAIDLVTQMISIPGKSGDERAVANFIVEQLKSYGIQDSQISYDSANTKSHIGGEIGNLIVDIPGQSDQPRRLLMAHIDTVPLCVGCQPVREGNIITSSDPKTALGGDDRAGATVVLNTIRLIQEHNLPHPPLTLLFAVQEEIGLVGAKNVEIEKLKQPAQCYNWDGGLANLAVIGATGDDHIEIDITGIASHAGAAPEQGVSAAAIAAMAINSLVNDGWHGLIQKGKQSGTSNIGVIQGGDATNVVMDQLHIKAEARSHNPTFRAKIVGAIDKAFQRATKELQNSSGKTGSISVTTRHKYESFRLDVNEPVVQTAIKTMEALGLEPTTRISNGGLDANWMNAHGLPTVTMGCGQHGIHTVKEELHIDQFLNACRIGLLIGTGTI
ncbi:M20/M25/M40 family metallo-hydrolase [Thalassoglobus sp.]|uniref:M20/M25/M40 family metallo-hydrolase n=1 Tax=Thalassoglobus sp. TaxID=2795869 RepID=UPI003AA859ED